LLRTDEAWFRLLGERDVEFEMAITRRLAFAGLVQAVTRIPTNRFRASVAGRRASAMHVLTE
jgi:hypothetical protein